MMPWNPLTNVTDGQTITSSVWNEQIRDNLNFLYGPFGTIAKNATPVSVPASSNVSVTFDTEIFDNANAFSGPADFFTCQQDGYYLLSSNFSWASAGSGERRVYFSTDFGNVPGGFLYYPLLRTSVLKSFLQVVAQFSEGDKIRLRVNHTVPATSINFEATMSMMLLNGT